jgi:hypothetical protein
MQPEQPRMPAVSCHVSSNSSLFSQALPLLPAVRCRPFDRVSLKQPKGTRLA